MSGDPTSEAKQEQRDDEPADDELSEDEIEDLPDDVYVMVFVSPLWGQAFFYAFYVYTLKIVIFTFLVLEALERLRNTEDITRDPESRMVLVAQFLMLPVAVAIQDDLISTFFMVANLKYNEMIEERFPHASKPKFYATNFLRGFDGFYSLLVNFLVLLTATDVLSVFLNFAALQFLQEIDNIAVGLAADGYMSDLLEHVAAEAKDAQLPRNHNKLLRSLDSILFFSTVVILVIGWCVVHFVVRRNGGDV